MRAHSDVARVNVVNAETGIMRGVVLISADREAAGHGVWIDVKTLETFRAGIGFRKIKAYATHGTCGKDGTLDEIGYWQAPRIDGLNLRADFHALEAWRKHHGAEFDKLFELAAIMPEEFCASLAFRCKLVWVRKDGTEIETERKLIAGGMWEFTPAMPTDALRKMPSVRCTEVFSADFVDQPAATDGLFRAGDAPRHTFGVAERGVMTRADFDALSIGGKMAFATSGGRILVNVQQDAPVPIRSIKVITRTQFDAMNAAEKMAFSVEGGRIA
jgi:hypothetical protein